MARHLAYDLLFSAQHMPPKEYKYVPITCIQMITDLGRPLMAIPQHVGLVDDHMNMDEWRQGHPRRPRRQTKAHRIRWWQHTMAGTRPLC